MVKNAVIVPTGRQGRLRREASDGRRPTSTAPRVSRATASSSPDCSTSPTTSSAGQVVPPPDTVRYDGDDPYLVVAADKGTATFSDIANEISAEYGFWLGDAFASGGSAGYDHKAMGITARGAWESVAPARSCDRQGRRPRSDDDRRHRRHVGRRVRQRPAALAARAAASPRSITATCSSIPTPIPLRRSPSGQRLFALPRSSWADYDPTLLSAGRRGVPADGEEHRRSRRRRSARSASTARRSRRPS